MKITFTKKYFAQLYQNNATLTLWVDSKEDREALVDLSKMIQENYEMEISVDEPKRKRSTNANAYAWVLLGKLSKVLGITPEEIYQQQILGMFTYRDVLVKTEDIEKEGKEWVKDHLGRDFKVIGPSPEHAEYSWCRKYRSSSDFDTVEMSKLIDNIVVECIEQGIETKTPAEIEKLKSAWKG